MLDINIPFYTSIWQISYQAHCVSWFLQPAVDASSARCFGICLHQSSPFSYAASDLINVMSDVTDACSVLYLKGGSCFCSPCPRLPMYAHERARRCALPALGFPPMPKQRHTTNYKLLWKDFFSFLTKAVLTKVVLNLTKQWLKVTKKWKPLFCSSASSCRLQNRAIKDS